MSDAATADGGSPAEADYTRYTHQQLYDWLRSGDPEQVRGLHAGWLSMAHDADSVGRSLARDLGRLQWDGAAGDEYRSRMATIYGFAKTLGQGFEPISEAISVMAGDLGAARSAATPPAATTVADNLATAVPALGVLPQVAQDKKAAQAGHAKMVELVTSLAEAYQTTSYGRIVPPANPPSTLPTHSNGVKATDNSGPTGTYQATSTLYGTPTTGATPPPTGAYTSPGQPPTLTYGGQQPITTQPVTTLAGTGPVTGIGAAGVAQVPTTVSVPAASYGTGLVAAPGVLPAQGNASTELGASPRRPTMPAGEAETTDPLATRRTAAATSGNDRDGDQSEYTTWLTDDLMVWADPLDLPPAVLGEPSPNS